MIRMMRFVVLAAALTAPTVFAQYSTPVREVERPEKRAFNVNYACSGVFCTPTNAPTVPAGYRIVFEFVSAYFGAGERLLSISLDNTFAIHTVAPTWVSANGSTSVIQQPVRFYNDKFPDITLIQGTAPSSYSITLSGYLAAK